MRAAVSHWRGLYAIVDPEQTDAPLALAEAILQGGCAVLQLRDKRGDDRDTLGLARALRLRCAGRGVPFVMNDRFDLARLADADGLHLGQDDLPIDEVRPHFAGPIGLSTHDLQQAHGAAKAGADLIGFGPVFPTTTKKNPDPTVGLEGLRAVSAAVDLPVVAIGGLDLSRFEEVRDAGAALGATIGALARAEDAAELARAMHEVWA